MDRLGKIALLAFASFLVVLASVSASAKGSIRLKFDDNEKFKIVQFTDLHTIVGDSRSEVVFENFRSVIDAEKPDLVIITGDMIYSGPGVEKFAVVLDSLNSFGVPFVVTFGNHDRQFGSTNAQLWDVARRYTNFVGTSASDVDGVGNCDLVIEDPCGRPAAVVYCFDSHEDSRLKPRIEGYDYIKRSQIEWYVNRSDTHRSLNGGKPLQSMAFFHIPLPEYSAARCAAPDSLVGIRGEKECPSQLNSGLFAAFVEQGDISGVFVGHDHDNDYAVPYYGILLAYGRFSGGRTEYFNLAKPGARVVELTRDSPTFQTWIRLVDKTVNERITY